MAFGGFGEVEEAEGSRGDGDAEEGAGDGEEADTRRKGKIRGQDKEGNHKVCESLYRRSSLF